MITNESLASALAPLGEPMLVPKAAMLFDAGEPCTGIYIVRSGAVDLFLLSGGSPVWSRTVNAGGVVGLPAAVAMKEYSLRAVANDNAELVFVPGPSVHAVIRNNPAIGMEILRTMSEELVLLRQKFAMFKAS